MALWEAFPVRDGTGTKAPCPVPGLDFGLLLRK